jgi:hypothetical protein
MDKRQFLEARACVDLSDEALENGAIHRMVAFIEAHAVAGDDPEAQAILDLIRPVPKDAAQTTLFAEKN